MNELMIVIGGSQWIYFLTEQPTAVTAFQEYTKKCGRMGLNFDNVDIIKVVLRDRHQNDIDFIEFEAEVP